MKAKTKRRPANTIRRTIKKAALNAGACITGIRGALKEIGFPRTWQQAWSRAGRFSRMYVLHMAFLPLGFRRQKRIPRGLKDGIKRVSRQRFYYGP